MYTTYIYIHTYIYIYMLYICICIYVYIYIYKNFLKSFRLLPLSVYLNKNCYMI